MKRNLGWHFIRGDKLRDGTTAPADGVWLEYSGDLVMCESGLHFSKHPHEALRYAPGETLCLVEVGGQIIVGDDKGVCSRRRIIARMDATEMLRFYARMQAVKALEYWDTEPPEVVCDYLLTGDESLRDAARAAAWAAARDAARDAAGDAAGDAARDAAWAAAMDAARAAARDAAWAAARDAARAAAWAAAWATAGDAAWAAARDAARDAADAEFNSIVYECFADFLPRK